MKKSVFCLTICLIFCLILSACNAEGHRESIQTDVGDQQVYEALYANLTREGTDEFMALLSPMMEDGHIIGEWQDWAGYGGECTVESCYNVTPLGFFERTGVRIFKFDFDLSFFLFNSVIYPVGLFGGHGLLSAVPFDYDLNGTEDILYSYSWGNHSSRCDVAVFNVETCESMVIHSTSNTDTPDLQLIVREIPQEQTVWYDIVRVMIAEPDSQNWHYGGYSYTIIGDYATLNQTYGQLPTLNFPEMDTEAPSN